MFNYMRVQNPIWTRQTSKQRLLGMSLILLLTLFFGTVPAGAQSCGSVVVATVSNESELETAVTCFNSLTQAGHSEISFAQDIALTALLPEFNNTTEGVTLTIRGNGYTLSSTSRFQLIHITANTTVDIKQITLSRGALGIRNWGQLTVSDSTFANNSSAAISSTRASSNLLVERTLFYSNGRGVSNGKGTAVIINSTISSNGSRGVSNTDRGTLTIINSTISNNNGYGLRANDESHTIVYNSIIANSNSGVDCDNDTPVPTIEIFSSIVESTGSCNQFVEGLNNNIIADPMLEPLADNGGLTQTHALQADSPALDSGDNTAALDAAGNMLSYDQRGAPYDRIANGTVDRGAYETAALQTTDCQADFTLTAENETELNEAIGCFNGLTAASDNRLLLLADITLTGNTAVINNTQAGVSLTIEGNNYAIDGAGVGAPVNIDGTATTVTINNLTARNSAGVGIANRGQLTLNSSTVVNSARNGVRSWQAGKTSINDSTIYNNGDKGIVANNTGQLTIYNSTVSNNVHYGIYGNGGDVAVTLTHSTIVENGNIGVRIRNGNMQVSNSLLADNFTNSSSERVDCDRGAGGTLNITYSLVKTPLNNCNLGDGNVVDADPQLQGLADNGGNTLTHALAIGSPAIDAIGVGVSGCNSENLVDQRGEARPQGGGCDMGAVETAESGLSGTAVVPATGSSTTTTNLPLILILGGILLLGMVGVVVRQRRA